MERVAALTSQDHQPTNRQATRRAVPACAWCRPAAPARSDEPREPATHGICPTGLARLLAALARAGATA